MRLTQNQPACFDSRNNKVTWLKQLAPLGEITLASLQIHQSLPSFHNNSYPSYMSNILYTYMENIIALSESGLDVDEPT